MINSTLRKYNKFIVYSILVIIAIIPCIIMLNKGFIWGHDNAFHYAQIQDLYDAIRSGNFNYYLNFETANYLGVGVRLMYGSLSHLITALIGILITPLGLSLTAAMKIVIVLSMILSSIYTYKFIYRITGRQITGILASAIFVLFPYRFCLIYVRNAFAETIALSLVPVVFTGVYGIIHDSSSSLKPYFQTIIGMTLLILTHNITAFYTAFFVVIYALFYLDKIFKKIKNKYYSLNIFISILFIVLLCSWFLLPLLESRRSNLYRVFDSEAMGTNLKSIINSSKSSIAYYQCGLNFRYQSNLLFACLLGLSLSFLIYFFNLYFFKRQKRYFVTVIISFICFICCLIFSIFSNVDYVVYLSLIIVPLAFFIPLKGINQKILKKDIIAFLTLTILTLILIFCGNAWKILPTIFYNIQFTWRLFGFLGFFMAASISIGFSTLNYNAFARIINMACGFFIVISFVIIKPISTTEYYYSESSKWDIENTIKKEDTYYMYSTGWQLEYFTVDFFDSNVSKSSYWWEIYYKYLADGSNGEAVDHPGLISGRASFSNYKYNNGTITFDLFNNEESIIEVARVYYKGYHATIKDSEGVIHNLECFNNESYVAFKTDLSGEVTVYYKKTPTMNAGILISYITLICFIGLICINKDYEIEWNN